MNTTPDHYKVLGLPPTASHEEIKSAYRRLVKKYHPDHQRTLHQKTRAEDRFIQITDSYKVLSDPKRKPLYDWQRMAKTIVSAKKGKKDRGVHSPSEEFRAFMIWILHRLAPLCNAEEFLNFDPRVFRRVGVDRVLAEVFDRFRRELLGRR